ncbi:copper chaperone PCu(A)C [Sphingomonas baiyangensis]|uniref:Copper chaperone PCu(A)C n=2 Tax=Sphingomonas baiyangensis TaxID=2572576 RepID=A0A4U1L593_9SPHN|nr:copper chaperone PCu(A)C [Sphingomonas baiyangensis]
MRLLAPLLMLAGCQQQEAVVVEDAWVRLPAVAGRPGAAYFTLAAREPQVLTAVATPAAARTELHESMSQGGGMMSMRPLADVAIAPGEPTRFAPGGRHVMLFDMPAGLAPGGTTTLTLRFADGRSIEAQAQLVGAGDASP